MSEMELNKLVEVGMRYGHLPILVMLAWIAVGLHRHGVKMTFDLRIWKNGKSNDRKDSIGE